MRQLGARGRGEMKSPRLSYAFQSGTTIGEGKERGATLKKRRKIFRGRGICLNLITVGTPNIRKRKKTKGRNPLKIRKVSVGSRNLPKRGKKKGGGHWPKSRDFVQWMCCSKRAKRADEAIAKKKRGVKKR